MQNLRLIFISFAFFFSFSLMAQEKEKKPVSNQANFVCNTGTIIGCNLFTTLPQSQLICSNTSIIYPGPVGNSCVDGAIGTAWGCIDGRSNQTWFYVTVNTTGPIQFNFTNSASIDVDGIIWGPLVNNNLSQACDLTTTANKGCDFRSNANVQLPQGGFINAVAGQIYILCVLNFENTNTNITISQPTGGSVQYCMAPPITQNCAFVDCNSTTNCGINPIITQPAVEYLCQQQIVKGFTPQDIVNNRILSPASGASTKIARVDLAKITLLSLLDFNQRVAFANNPTGSTFIAENFPVPFVDLQKSNTNSDSVRYAKVLSYLDYADGRPPFDRRDSTNFNPTNNISRSLVLKVLLEAWNIDEFAIDNAAPMPFADAGLGTHPQYRYIKKAYELGIIDGTVGSLFSPDVNCSREDAFLMLYKIMTSTTITKPTLTQINAGFFTPGQYRPDNLGVGVGTDRGNFNHYTKTSFAMDGVVPLIFAHSYNSFTTELPNEMYPNVMGRGWTHSFNCYITSTGSGKNARLVVHYPDGKLHYYKAQGGIFVPESIGVFDAITTTGSTVTITTPSKIEYYFEKMTGQSGNFWLIRTIKDRNTNTLTFTNQLGINNVPRLASVADQAGRSLTFTYLTGELRNYLSQVTLAGVGASFNGRNVQFTYHPLVLDGDGIKDLATYKEYDLVGTLKPTLYSYLTVEGSEHLLKTITLPKLNVIDNTYEKRKLRSSQTLNGATVVQQMNTNWTQTYTPTSQSSTGSVSVITSGVTKTTNYTHNSNGLAQTINTTGTSPINLKMNYGLSQDPTSVTNIVQKTMGGTQDSTGVRIKYYTTPPYNVEYVKTAKTVGDSITQSYIYNTFNDISSFTNGRGLTTTFGYNINGNLTSINHPLGQPTTMLRNLNGTIQKVTTPSGIVTDFTYNNYGNLLTTSTPNGSNPAITTSATYDALSRVISKTDARNQTVTYDYFANDLLKKMNAPLSYYVEYNYDLNDNNTTVTNAKGNATTNVYNTQTDQLISRSFGNKTESFTYFEDGSLKTFTNGRGDIFAFTYDPSGRVTNDGYAAYEYNVDGTINNISHTNITGGGNKTYLKIYDYDALRRIRGIACTGYVTAGLSVPFVKYTYDNNNNVTSVIYPDNKTVTRTFDNKDRLITLTDWAGRLTTYVYDDDGKILNYTLPNGSKAIYTYDAAGRPTGISHQKSTNAIICSSSFVLDQGGNHLEENIIEPYTTVPAIAASTTTYTTNPRNETIQVGSSTYAFDGNGAVTSQAGTSLIFDTKDNLKFRNGTFYFYDGVETRRSKIAGLNVTNYVIDDFGNNVLATEDGGVGGYTYYYVYGPTGLLYRQSTSGVVEYYHYDFRGSTVAMTDASQNVVKQYQYDAYGKILQQTPLAANDDNPFRYVGQHGVQYEDANLYFMRARYYDPNTGKFLSEDPIWSTNLFVYGDNNPVMGIDPSGKIVVATVVTMASAGIIIYQGTTMLVDQSLALYFLYKSQMAKNEIEKKVYLEAYNEVQKSLSVGYVVGGVLTKIEVVGKLGGEALTELIGKSSGFGWVNMSTKLGLSLKDFFGGRFEDWVSDKISNRLDSILK